MYLICEDSLAVLLRFCCCKECRGPTESNFVGTKGSMLQVSIVCTMCGYQWTWNSQPSIRGENIPIGNVLISSAILFSGSLVSKVLRIFKIMNCAAISEDTYHRHQRNYLHPAICMFWEQQQKAMFSVLQMEEKQMVLGGDGRCDSPGFCAKFCSYTFMELEHNVILDVQLVQVTH